MKKTIQIIFALACLVTILITPVAAKPGDNPDPVCDICTKLNALGDLSQGTSDIQDAIDALQGDIDAIDDKLTDIQSVVEDINAKDTGNIVYTTGQFNRIGKTDYIVIELSTLGLSADTLVDIRDFPYMPTTRTYTDAHSCEGKWLKNDEQYAVCFIYDTEYNTVIQIEVSGVERDAVIPKVSQWDSEGVMEIYMPGDFKITG